MQLNGIKNRILHHARAGFTLSEVLIATTISMVALAAVASFNRFQLFALRNQATQLDIQSAARGVADLFAREVRRAGLDPTCGKQFSGIVDARSFLLHIQSDLNGNGVIDGPDEDVSYAYNSAANSIERTANGTTDTLVSGPTLAGSTLRYFDSAGAELIPQGSPPALTPAQRDSVRRVRIQLTLQAHAIDPQNRFPMSASISTDVDLRNRFFLSNTRCS